MSKRHPRSPAQTAQWRHLGLRGNAAMMQSHCKMILDSATVTDEARHLAYEIQERAVRLAEELRTQLPIKE